MSIDKAVADKAQVAFIRARLQLLNKHPFWAHLVLKLRLEWMEDVLFGISCTDGERLMIQADNYLKLSGPEQVAVLVHEAAHCAMLHLSRCGARDLMQFNIAGDVYIANMLEAEGFQNLKGGELALQSLGIDRSQFKNMTTEQIYDKLPFKRQQGGGGSGKGTGKGKSQGQGAGQPHWNSGDSKCGCFKPAKDQAEAGSREREWRQAVVEAGQMAGDKAGAWKELVDAAMPKLPFHLKLWEYLERGLGGDSDWTVLNRKHIYRGQYMPSEVRQVMGRVVWVADTSGSMGQAELAQAFGFFRSFREEHPCKADLVCCDCGVASHKTFEEWEPLPDKFEAAGRGGTSFDAPFQLVREKAIEPVVLIYVTDGYGSVSNKSKPSRYPVLWVVVGGNREFKPGFGEVVHALPTA
jgi:predicted metal-dependent peptidase